MLVIETESLKAWRGREAYVEDVRRRPNYDDGSPRMTWEQLGPVEQGSWVRNPTARDWKRANPFLALESELGGSWPL